MGKVETAFKSEVTRLAKKEIKFVVTPLQREVRALKRRVGQLAAELRIANRVAQKAAQAAAQQSPAVAPGAPEEAGKARLSGGLIKKLRSRLGITQGQLAALVGVSAAAVQTWEQNVARPGSENRAALLALRQRSRREVAELLEQKGVAATTRKPRIGAGRRQS